MAGTTAGNRKIAAAIKEKWGVDDQGRSRFHSTIGSIGGENSHGGGFFKRLKAEDPERLAEIASKGGKARKKQVEGKNDDVLVSHQEESGQA